ncbi:hypothetical protein KP509_18G070700 [Ceratopteris richardii]|uniref:Choline kinase n=1 Tax=Ceratopteris richardii TaxID=49495 RepID=A0A8T2SSY1_CERRI|nr:hypothetical protein KP509_18G070700 [Ceratopteris richardii]
MDSSLKYANGESDVRSKIPSEVLKILTLKLSLPEHLDDVCVRQLKGALTNEVYECSWIESTEYCDNRDANEKFDVKQKPQDKTNQRKVVLVRIYGNGVDNFFDREDEIQTFEAMSKAGHGPRLLARFSTGRIEEFLHARTLTAKDLRDPDVSARIAVKLREFHQLPIPGEREARIWKRLMDWLREALSMCTDEHIVEFNVKILGSEIEDLKVRSSEFKSRIGFCHNDLQYGNIMMDDKDGSLTIIDYEYATYNPVSYDIANHFCEMAANYHSDTPHLLDFSKYPDVQERQRFIRAYLGSPDMDISQSRVDKLSSEVDFYEMPSHIHWALWGLISHYVNGIDFDYLEYARQRLNKYYILKQHQACSTE